MPTNFGQNLKFQHVPESRVDDFQFNGGLVTDDHETNLEPNQSPDLANWLFNRKGSAKTRNGYLRFNGNPIGISSDQSNIGTELAETLIDNFDDNSIDASKWSTLGSCAETGGHIVLNYTSGSANYSTLESANTFNLTGSYISCQLVSQGNQALASFQAIPVMIYLDANNSVNWIVGSNSINAQRQAAGVYTTLQSAAYDSNVHKYFRIRESGGTTYWDYSTDGSSWTNFTSVSNPFALTAVNLEISAGCYSSEASSTSATFDNFNTDSTFGVLATSGDYIAQTFQPSGAISCVQINAYLAMINTGETQLVRAELWTTSGGAPSALLGLGQIILISGTSETAYSFRFREPVSLSASTTYAVVLRPFIGNKSPSVSAVNVFYRGATYGSGQVYTSTDSGITWTGSSTRDLKFVIYSGGNTGCTGLLRFYTSTGIAQCIAKIGTSLYRGNDGTGALTALTMGSGIAFTSANFLDYTITNDTLLVVDHDHNIQKYRGSTNANYSTGTITATNASNIIVGSGTSWATTTNCEVGEYIKLPDGKWYKVITVTDNTHVVIEINYQGATLSGQTYTISPWGEVQGKLNSSSAPTSLTVPKPKFIENHLDRIWGLDGNSLFFSTLDTSVTEENFNDFDTSNNAGEIIIPSGKGDTGTGLYTLGSYLYIFQRNAIWEIFGNSPANFELRNISNEIGMIDKRTLVEYNRNLYFLSDKGIYRFDGTNLENLTEAIVNSSINDWANKTSPAAVLWKNKYLLAYTPSGGSYNSEALFYDIELGIFGKVEGLFANCWVNWNGGNDTGQIYMGSSNQGSIYLWDTGGHDDGYEIDSRYETPSIGFGGRVDDKAVKKVYLQQLALGHWTMTASMTQDIDGTTQTETVDLDSGQNALWDVSQWDVSSWSPEGTLLTSRLTSFQGNAKYYRFLFENLGYDEGLELLGLTATARIRRLT